MNTRDLRFKSNRVKDIVGRFHEELDPLYGVGETGVFVDMLFEALLGWDKVQLLTSKEQTIDQSDLLRFHWALEDLRRQRPIQHIIGYTEFCGCRIEVTPDVLIPRPETEEMVQRLVWSAECGVRSLECGVRSCPNAATSLTFLDLCTGSGCIAIALKKAFPQAEVTAVDVSEKALAVARRNADQNGTPIKFLQADVLSDIFNFQFSTFNLIVSNPPYVRESERTGMRRNVLDYDPPLALFVPDDDPLRFYHAVADIACRCLAPEGLLVVEINENLADETCGLLCDAGFEPRVHTDFRGRSRFISAVRKG